MYEISDYRSNKGVRICWIPREILLVITEDENVNEHLNYEADLKLTLCFDLKIGEV